MDSQAIKKLGTLLAFDAIFRSFKQVSCQKIIALGTDFAVHCWHNSCEHFNTFKPSLYLHYPFQDISIFPISILPPILTMGISSSGNQNRRAADRTPSTIATVWYK